MELYLFNPEHDLALAHGEPHYLPPQIVRQFAQDYALLPFWYAKNNSSLLLFSEEQQQFLHHYNRLFNRSLTGIFHSQLKELSDLSKSNPWGWNTTLIEQLIKAGITQQLLPSLAYIKDLTQLSHRSFSVNLLPQLQLSTYFCGESKLFQSVEELNGFVQSHSHSVLKEPLSGSGRGIMWCEQTLIPSLQTWAKRVIERQNGVIAEPMYSKVLDFAMEFEMDSNSQCNFVGYSMFYTSSLGSYQGNHLLNDKEIEKRIAHFVPLEELQLLKEKLQSHLKDLVGSTYQGFLGVDMMICSFSDFPLYRIHPCVEVNFRMNMGLVAHSIQANFMDYNAQGKFTTYYYRKEGEALAEHKMMEKKYPSIIKNNKLVSGYLPLVPVTSTSRYRAWVIVE